MAKNNAAVKAGAAASPSDDPAYKLAVWKVEQTYFDETAKARKAHVSDGAKVQDVLDKAERAWVAATGALEEAAAAAKGLATEVKSAEASNCTVSKDGWQERALALRSAASAELDKRKKAVAQAQAALDELQALSVAFEKRIGAQPTPDLKAEQAAVDGAWAQAQSKAEIDRDVVTAAKEKADADAAQKRKDAIKELRFEHGVDAESGPEQEATPASRKQGET